MQPASTSTAATQPVAPPALATTTDHFCSDAQAFITHSRIAARNTAYLDREAFVLSKASVRPLETRQYLDHADAARTRPTMLSCKMKTADHIRTEYGPEAAGADESCAAVNQRSLDAVLRSLSSAERRRSKFGPRHARIVVEADEVVDNGGDWLRPFTLAWVGDDGALHLRAKGMNKGWTDPRYATSPTQYRGVRYCHLASPEYLRRLVLGEQ